jgi:hypothetical protein
MTHSLEICVHCYNPPGMVQYAEQLKFLLGALAHHPPERVRVDVTIVCSANDLPTLSVAGEGMKIKSDNVRVTPICLSEPRLFRRAIGRNLVARATEADAVWFTDCDYFPGPGFLDEFMPAMLEGLIIPAELNMPAVYRICKDHPTGDFIVSQHRDICLPCLHEDILNQLFVDKEQRIAIGGMQFVTGDFARARGYCDGTKWVREVDTSPGFRSCKCDKAFRSLNGLKARRVETLTRLYRLRHSVDGRDYDAHGKYVGKKAW